MAENGVLRVVLYGFQMPGGYDRSQVDVNVRIDPGYPDAQIDMVYVHPPLARADGVRIRALASDSFDGKLGSGGAGTGRRPILGAPASTTLPPISALSRNGSPVSCVRANSVTQTTLTLTSSQHAELHRHLFPDDGCEAVALILCGRRADPARHRLVARRVIPVPYDACSVRSLTRVTWSTGLLPPILEEAAKLGLALIKVHGHPHLSDFSQTDDKSDKALFPSVYAWTDN